MADDLNNQNTPPSDNPEEKRKRIMDRITEISSTNDLELKRRELMERIAEINRSKNKESVPKDVTESKTDEPELKPDETETDEAELKPDETETDEAELKPDETETNEAELKPDETETKTETDTPELTIDKTEKRNISNENAWSSFDDYDLPSRNYAEEEEKEDTKTDDDKTEVIEVNNSSTEIDKEIVEDKDITKVVDNNEDNTKVVDAIDDESTIIKDDEKTETETTPPTDEKKVKDDKKKERNKKSSRKRPAKRVRRIKAVKQVDVKESDKDNRLGVGAIVLIIILLLLIITTVFFILNQKRFKETLKAVGLEEVIPIDDNNTESGTTLNTNDELTSDAVPQLDSPVYNPDGTRKAELENNDKNTLNPKKEKDDKWGLARPCWVISFGSFTKEETAKMETAKLKGLGYSAGYYWIPDYRDKGSNQLYKVYVGPYNDKKEAVELLPAIRKLSHFNDAYVLKVD